MPIDASSFKSNDDETLTLIHSISIKLVSYISFKILSKFLSISTLLILFLITTSFLEFVIKVRFTKIAIFSGSDMLPGCE